MIKQKELSLFVLLFCLIITVSVYMGSTYTTRMLVEASCYCIIALGLTIQWGYAGLFNAGVMGFIALGGFMSMLFSYPIRMEFWQSEIATQLGFLGLKLIFGIALFISSFRLSKLRISKLVRHTIQAIILLSLYVWFLIELAPITSHIEHQYGFIGGLGLPVWLGWLAAGVISILIAYVIGKVCLGLRSDYLAIATLGIAEIIKTFLKNADWLTYGTITVSPLPWLTPSAADIGFIASRAVYLSVTAILVILIYILLTRAYYSPWGRMLRAIRDNEPAAEAMGKNLKRRKLEVFMLGCFFIGLGGAILTTFNGIFDPSGYLTLNHTFLIWVMIIVGGAGNNLGAIFGALTIYVLWAMSEPLTLWLFGYLKDYMELQLMWNLPADFESRPLQARVFIIGLAITLILRYAPKGLIPESLREH